MQRLRPLTEEECYLRCYGWVGSGDEVKVLEPEAPREPDSPSALAERVRLKLEAALEAAEREAA
jgi:hypothetical protein